MADITELFDHGDTPGVSSLDDFIPGAFPGVNSAIQHLGIRVPDHRIFCCLTGRSCLLISGTIEDDSLIFPDPGQPGFEFRTGNSPLEFHRAALGFIRIGAHQEGFPFLDLPVNLCR
jgi:hypothetical protein